MSNNCGCNETTIQNTTCNECPPETCTCAVNITTDCVTLNTTDPLPCSGVEPGVILTEAVEQLDAYICTSINELRDSLNLTNVGLGAKVYRGTDGIGRKELRTVIGSSLINVVENTDDINVSVNETAMNTFIEANQKTYSATNIGTGSQIYKDSTIVGDNTQLNLRKLKSSDSSVSIIEGIDDIDLTVSPVDLSPLEKINEGNGEGIVIRGRNSANYGNVGLNAVDLSTSTTISSVFGATGQLSFASNEENIASNYGSFASGLATESSGVGAHTEGVETIASEYGAHAEGVSAVASGHSAHAQNSLTLAEGTSSHAGGVETIARALASFVHGYWVEANSFAEFSIGTYGTTPSGSLLTWVGTDRLFNIGNGLNGASLSDALTALKNGLITFPSLTTALITAEPTGKVAITKEYLTSVLPPTPDGSETKINNGITTTKTGNGTIATPYVIELSNPQKEITVDYTLQAEDFNQTLFINNTIPITITIPITGLPANFCVGFVHETINDVTYTGSGVTNPIGLKSKGQGYQQFIERKLNTSTYYLLGNTKV